MINNGVQNFNTLEDVALPKLLEKTKKNSLTRLAVLNEIKKRGLLSHINKKNFIIFKLTTPILPDYRLTVETWPLFILYLSILALGLLGMHSQFKIQFSFLSYLSLVLLVIHFLSLDLSLEFVVTEFEATKVAKLFRIFPLFKMVVPLRKSGILITTSLHRPRGTDFYGQIFVRVLQKNTKPISFISETQKIFVLAKFLNDYFDDSQHPVFVDQTPSGIPEMVNAELQLLKENHYTKIFRPPINTRNFKDFCLSIACLENTNKQKGDIDSYWLKLIQHVKTSEMLLKKHIIFGSELKQSNSRADIKDNCIMQYPARIVIPKQEKYSSYSLLFSTFKISFTPQKIIVFDSNGLKLDSVCYSDIKIPPATSLESHIYIELNEQKFVFRIDGSFPIKEIILCFKNTVSCF